MTDVSLPELMSGWAKNRFHRVYLWGGPDTLTKDEAVQRLKQAFFGSEPSPLGYDTFDGNDASAGAVLSAVHTMAFFGGRRLVVVRRADGFGTAEATRLADGLGTIPESHCLVLLWDEKLDARSVLVQAVRSVGVTATVWPPFENQMPAWIAARAEAAGKKMDRDAAQVLLDQVGPRLPDLLQEIGKLVLFANDRPVITVEDVEVCGGHRAALRFMEWERALWRRSRADSLAVLEVLRGQGEPAEKLIPQLTRAVQKMCLGKALLAEKKIPKKQVFDRLWIRMLDAQTEFERSIPRWTWKDLLRALDRLVEVDAAMKRGRSHPDAELTRLVWALTEKDAVDA